MDDRYAEAVKCLEIAHKIENFEEARIHVAEAQVHATLAFVQWQRRVDVKHTNLDAWRSEAQEPGAHVIPPAESPGYVSIPWPPGEELRIRVEGIIADALRTASIRIRDELTLIEAVKWCTNAVLDAIGGE